MDISHITGLQLYLKVALHGSFYNLTGLQTAQVIFAINDGERYLPASAP